MFIIKRTDTVVVSFRQTQAKPRHKQYSRKTNARNTAVLDKINCLCSQNAWITQIKYFCPHLLH